MASRALNVLDCVAHLFETIKGKQLINHNDHILMTLSGGQDSICLAFMLWVLRGQLRSQIGHLWCNHLWQEGSFFTMLHLAQFNLACSSRILFSLATQPLLSEQAARDWRHAVIQRDCGFYAYNICTQGHTKSDRVETVLFNLVRGTGLAGISALQWACQKDVLPSCLLYATLLDLSKKAANRRPPIGDSKLPDMGNNLRIDWISNAGCCPMQRLNERDGVGGTQTGCAISGGTKKHPVEGEVWRAGFDLRRCQQAPSRREQTVKGVDSFPPHRCNRLVIPYGKMGKASTLRANSREGRGCPLPGQGSHISSSPVKIKNDG